jgi:conjugative transposon TraM protein
MEKTNHSAKFLKQRKFLMILPVLTLPFMTLMFWAFSGGKGNAMVQTDVHAGLNLKLPDAKFKDQKGLNKLSFYEQAALDSAKTKEAEKLDPYWNKVSNDSNFQDSSKPLFNDYGMDANKRKVYDKLDELKKALNKSEQASNYNQQQSNPYSLQSFSSSKEADRLQAMMQNMKEDKSEDPEITQLNSMLDKIMAIQNPEQKKNSDKPSSDKRLSVKTKKQKADISLLKSNATKTINNDTAVEGNTNNAFYSISDNMNDDDDSVTANSIEAIIPETQTIVAGATIKLALSNDVTIKNVLLSAGAFVYGTASLSNERLKVSINSIRFENSILPVSLDVYDMDGQEGIYVPGSINRTVAKESANNVMSGMNATTIDPSIGAQAASAGIEAAKSLFSKKIKLIKMTVKAGYKVLLKDSHEK